MGVIAKLNDRVVNQIAAGEVVERPLAVVKELVENSIDAQANRIEIVFEKGGKSLIRVTDNGVGMSPEDAELAVERHATSKIKLAEDLDSIASFGFRGEALPSIASVSRFILKTRKAENPEGTEIRINGGKGKSVQACGMPPGTQVEVAQLFNSLPARRKFLKTDRTEASHIIHLCRLLAIGNPSIAFTLIEEGREVFNSPACPSLGDRISEIYGKQRAKELMPIMNVDPNGRIELSGVVAKLGASRSSRSEMITFVNGRPVDSRLLNYALIESYHSYLPRGRYPVAFLFLQIDPKAVDVNVHPAKREVRFRDEGFVRQFVMESIIDRLREESQRGLRQAERVDAIESPIVPKPWIKPDNVKPLRETEGQISTQRGYAPTHEVDHSSLVGRTQQNLSDMRSDWQFQGVLREHMGLFTSEAGLVLLDARRAYRRISYERILEQLLQKKSESQDLMFPLLLELDPVQANLLGENLGYFKQLGFDLELFGGQSFRLRAYPAWFEADESEGFVKDLISSLSDKGLRPENQKAAAELVAKMALKRTRIESSPRSTNEWNELVSKILDCKNPLLDHLDRKVFVEYTNSEIDRKFES